MTAEEKKRAQAWAIGCHLSGLLLYLGLPFGNIIGPLVIWLIKRAEYPLVDRQGKEAVNFQISVTLYALVAGVLFFLLIGIPLLFILVIFQIVMVIIAAIKVSNGVAYKYPFTIRLIK